MPLRTFHAALIAALLCIAEPAVAHHGTGDLTQRDWITVTGTVTKFLWMNPHSLLILDVSGANGTTVSYTIVLPAPALLWRTKKWTRRTFKVGDAVEIRVYPSRLGRPVGECPVICLANANEYLLPSGWPRGRRTSFP